MIYVRISEYCDWERETWYFYFQWHKNRGLLNFINGLNINGFEAKEVMLLNDTRKALVKSGVRGALIKDGKTTRNEHNFIEGIVDIKKIERVCKDDDSTRLGALSPRDALYKAGVIQNFVIQDMIPSYSKDFKL